MTSERGLQLDLFADSRDVMLRNDLIEALQRHDAAAAAHARAALQAEYPADAAVADAALLVAELQSPTDTPFSAIDDVLAERATLAQPVAEAARRALGEAAAALWLRPFWARLARRAALLPWRAEAAEAHAAALWLQAQDWREAQRAVEAIPSWRRIPAPLAWMAQSRWHQVGLDATWPLLVELAWLAPARLALLAQELPDRVLKRLVRRFEDEFEDAELADGWAWLPAWALTEQPLLATAMAGAEPWRHTTAEQGWQVMQALLRLERQGLHHEVVAHRQRLRGLSETLFAAYMRTR